MHKRIELAQEVGFTFNYFEGMIIVNTQDGHILLDYAKEFGLQTELNLRLVTAFYTECKDISDRKVLAQELEAVGLNSKEGIAKLDDVEVRRKVIADESHWKSLGITGVPTMIFNQKSRITGAYPVDMYKEVLTELLEEQ